MGLQHLLEDRRRPLAFLERRDERDADVPLAGIAEVRAGCDDHTVAEQPFGTRLRGRVPGNLDPEVHRRLAGGDAPALSVEYAEENVALAAGRAPWGLHVRLGVP